MSGIVRDSGMTFEMGMNFESHKKVGIRKLETPSLEGHFGKYGFRGQTEAGIVKSICKLMGKHVSDC